MKKENGALTQVGDEIPFLNSKKVNIEFSPDGRFLAILHKKINLLEIWEIEDSSIENLFEGIRENSIEPLVRIEDDSAFKKTKNLEFDSNSKYLVCFGLKSMNIINLEDTSSDVFNYSIQKSDYFRAILDVQLVSEDDGSYRCDLACRAEGSKSIILFTISEDDEEKR